MQQIFGTEQCNVPASACREMHTHSCSHCLQFNFELFFLAAPCASPVLAKYYFQSSLKRAVRKTEEEKHLRHCFNFTTKTIVIFRALSSGSGFIKLNGYHSESNVAKDGVELNSTHMNLSSACCSANRDLKEMFCLCFHWILSKMQPSHWLSPSNMCMCKERL